MTAALRGVLSILLAIVWTARSGAADSPFPDIQRILKSKKLVVAILAGDAPPMIMTDKAGRPIGFEVELAQDIGKKLGVAVKFVRTAETYDGVVQIIARGEADIAVSFLSRSVKRAKDVYFTDAYVRQSARLIYNRVGWAELRERFPSLKEIEQIRDTEAATAIEVGVLKESIYAARAERDVPRIRARTYDSFPDIMTAVKDGKIFAAYHGEIQIQYYMRQNPETALYIGIAPEAQKPSDISIAVRPDAPNLLRWLNIYLANHVGVLDAKGVIKHYRELHAEEPKISSSLAD
jgi:ABC-type amino acid transport substrate-binding protein